MRGRFGVADQDHVFMSPALAADGRKIAPNRAIGDQLVAVELFREYLFKETGRRGFVLRIESRALEGFGIGLHHPGRAPRLILIAVRDEDAVLSLAKKEIEGIHWASGTHPGEIIRT